MKYALYDGRIPVHGIYCYSCDDKPGACCLSCEYRAAQANRLPKVIAIYDTFADAVESMMDYAKAEGCKWEPKITEVGPVHKASVGLYISVGPLYPEWAPDFFEVASARYGKYDYEDVMDEIKKDYPELYNQLTK